MAFVEPGGQAEQLGLVKNDLIREINGLPVPSVRAIQPIFKNSDGHLHSMKVVRGKSDVLLSRDDASTPTTQNGAAVVDADDSTTTRQPLPPGIEVGKHSAPQQFQIGEAINEHVWSGKEWLPTRTVENDPDRSVVATPQPTPRAVVNNLSSSVVSPPQAKPQMDTGGLFSPVISRFLIGCAVAIGVSIAGLITVKAGQGGIIWVGGYILTLGLWRGAWRTYKAIRNLTGQSLNSGSTLLVALALLVTLSFAGWFGFQKSETASLSPTAGSCWKDEGSTVVLVSCSASDAAYVGSTIVSNTQNCPAAASSYVELNKTGNYLCLEPK